MDADLLVLPGGFLVGHDSESRKRIADEFIDEARSLDLSVVFGVDDIIWPIAYGYAWSAVDRMAYCWEERSSTRFWNKMDKQQIKLTDNEWDAKLKSYDEIRLITTDGGVAGVLLCGELFNERIQNALIKLSPHPKIVVDIIHRGQGFRSAQTMKKLCCNGIASACSAHALKKCPMKRCYIPGKGDDGNVSPREFDSIIYVPSRIELKLFEV
ncbi:MAG TPA: hypothetical protein PKV33_07535 [Methanothrix sp.]|nr:hypothetical protein [Methanothrix sp.]